MSSKETSWNRDWSVGLRVWVERAGRTILGDGRLELLEGIDSEQSISAAARQMRISYRKAWLLVQDINTAAGLPLVKTATGGHHGGGARLTEQGRQAIVLFRQLREQLRRTAASLLPRLVQGPDPATVHVAAAVSLEEVLGQLMADYTLLRPAVCVRAVFGASDELADLLLGGAPVDLLLTADPRPLDRLEAAELVQANSRAAFAGNSLAVIGLAGSSVSVRQPADLSRLPRIALAGPTCPLGRYTRAYLESLALYESLLSRAILVDSSQAVLSAVRAGQAGAGVTYGSAAAHAEGCRVLFRASRLPTPVRYTGVVVRRGRQPEEAQRLLDFLTSSRAASRFRSCGFVCPRRPSSA